MPVKPHADHECSRCNKTFDVEIGTPTCPACGKGKWFTRLYNSVNISTTGIAKKKEPMLERAFAASQAPKEASREVTRRWRSSIMPQAVDPNNIAGALQHQAKTQLQAAGMPESRMPSSLPGPSIKPGKSSYKDGTVRKALPVDPSLSKEMKLHHPRSYVAGKTSQAENAQIAAEVAKGKG